MVLAPALPGLSGIASQTILIGRTIISDFSDGHDRHLVLADRNGLHRITIVTPEHPYGHHVAIMPDDYWAIRLAVLEQFAGNASLGTFGCLHPTTAQRRRLTLMLKVLDCLNATKLPKPTLRGIAEAVLYPRHDLGRAIEWKCSSERRQTQRLLNSARYLMQGGYRELLKGRLAGPGGKHTASAISQQSDLQAIESGQLP
ncbi:DUF2285 domain-containing protein [Novosphingobium subterraneum]|uniref:DUF2285 domain-containing protein n=1 Tax=Novosphingobium subterraneum TaxID=48936 RepID=UPI003CFF01B4